MLPPGRRVAGSRFTVAIAAACLAVTCAPAAPAGGAADPNSHHAIRNTQQAARPVSFLYDVAPILSRAGCNNGNCHGNAEGRGGLRLSLKGEDPGGDHAVLTGHGGARRVNRQNPGASLVLLKATSTLPHGGGPRFRTGSQEYRALSGWIAEGARMDPPGSPRLLRLDVLPRASILVAPVRTQRLTVLGRFSDGTVRDLTRHAMYNPGDPVVQVSPDGLVSASGAADLAVLVRFADQLANARLTFVPASKEFAWKPIQAHNWIDHLQFARFKVLRLFPSDVAGDPEFLRRSYLDAIGTLPSPDEARAFLGDIRPDKRARLIDALLGRTEFDDFWTLKWSDVLRVEERTLDPKGAAAYRDWIRASIAGRKPFDQFARELLTASGGTYANPPANYYRRTRDPEELGENTAQTFMGTRLLCAKCHNHPFERWKQDDYYSLAAFFARVDRKGEFTRKDKFDLHELIGEETIGVAGQGFVKHPRTESPVSPGLATVGFSPPLSSTGDPRPAFAEWLTRPDNPYFARAMANRIWFHLLGRGIVDPVDDLRESNPPSNPALLDALARDFAARGFDLRHTVRTIMNSRTYQLSSTPNATNAADERFFSRSIPQRLSAEVLLDALGQVTESPDEFAGKPTGTRAVHLVPVNKQRHAFLRLFGQPARESVCECERAPEPTLGQSFALIGGEAIESRLRRPGNRIGRLLAAGKQDGEIVRELYLAALSREPSGKESANALAYVGGKDRRTALEDLLWAILNSKEFLLRR